MSSLTPDLLERARGAMLGMAVGDAFGMALDGGPCRHVNAQVRSMGQGRLPAGHFTECTGAALTLSEGLLAPEMADDELAERITAWSKSRRPRPDPQPRSLFTRLLGGTQPRAAANFAPAQEPEPADASPLSRCLPIALAHVSDRNACLAEARRLVRLTHEHPDCVAGGAFAAVVLWHLLHGMGPREAVYEGLRVCGDLSDTLEESIRLASTRRREFIRNEDLVEPLLESVVRGLVTTSFFVEAVARVANMGGSAALASTLVGAYAGAVHRHSGIPADWRTLVHGTWPPRGGTMRREQDLVELADRLVMSRSDKPYLRRTPSTRMTISV